MRRIKKNVSRDSKHITYIISHDMAYKGLIALVIAIVIVGVPVGIVIWLVLKRRESQVTLLPKVPPLESLCTVGPITKGYTATAEGISQYGMGPTREVWGMNVEDIQKKCQAMCDPEKGCRLWNLGVPQSSAGPDNTGGECSLFTNRNVGVKKDDSIPYFTGTWECPSDPTHGVSVEPPSITMSPYEMCVPGPITKGYIPKDTKYRIAPSKNLLGPSEADLENQCQRLCDPATGCRLWNLGMTEPGHGECTIYSNANIPMMKDDSIPYINGTWKC